MSKALRRSGWQPSRPERDRFRRIGLAVSIAPVLLTGIAQAQTGSLDNPPPTAAGATRQVAVAAPEAIAPPASPAIDSVSLTTNLAAFLKSGVPVDLLRAALRRAWISDPAIRDFVGLSEDLVEPGR